MEYIAQAQVELKKIEDSIKKQVSLVNDRGTYYVPVLLEEIKNKFTLISDSVNNGFLSEINLFKNRYIEKQSVYENFQKYLGENAELIAKNASEKLKKQVEFNESTAQSFRIKAEEERRKLIEEQQKLCGDKKTLSNEWFGDDYATSHMRSEIADGAYEGIYRKYTWWDYVLKEFRNWRLYLKYIILLMVILIETSGFGDIFTNSIGGSAFDDNRIYIAFLMCFVNVVFIYITAKGWAIRHRNEYFQKRYGTENRSKNLLPKNKLLIIQTVTAGIILFLLCIFKAKIGEGNDTEYLIFRKSYWVALMLLFFSVGVFLLEYYFTYERLDTLPSDYREKLERLTQTINQKQREINYLNFFTMENITHNKEVYMPKNIKAKGFFIENETSSKTHNIQSKLIYDNKKALGEYIAVLDNHLKNAKELLSDVNRNREEIITVENKYTDFFLHSFYPFIPRFYNALEIALTRNTSLRKVINEGIVGEKFHINASEYLPNFSQNIIGKGTEELKKQFELHKIIIV